ncbi:HD domain-containing protein [Alkalihalobacillus sp. AL-G]|uniref:HD domain-containing protein n=1 Tax=Alkalihalobacillus sp. AL-G TaxID=2926399 RepID=UPI002729E899|nr:HD domain-containing protein [Alkalihalobacillus sp. AL-G]WLD94916.1 HD domain-containing protein [Alkalihalobacillus sp. AL-G]
MRKLTLIDIFQHPQTQKYLKRSGIAHAIASSYHAVKIAKKLNVDPDLATKAALLHDIGHYTWYSNGEWDYDLYKANDIHAIKGAERAHKLLIELDEDRMNAKEIALAILLHTDSYLPEGELKLNPLQQVVKLADEADEKPGGKHHYRTISDERAKSMINQLDTIVNKASAEYSVATSLKQPS